MRIPTKEELLRIARRIVKSRKVQIAAGVVVLLVLIVAALPFFIDVNRFCRRSTHS